MGVGVQLFLILLLPVVGLANNHHEHLTNLPRAEDFLVAEKRVVAMPVVLDALLSPNTPEDRKMEEGRRNLEVFVLTQGQRKPDGTPRSQAELNTLVNRALAALSPTMTVGDLATLLGEGDRKVGLPILLRMPEEIVGPTGLARKNYTQIENLRKRILETASVEDFTRIYDSYFKSENLFNKGVMDISVPPPYFQEPLVNKIKALRKLMKEQRLQSRLFYSVGRSMLMDPAARQDQALQRAAETVSRLHKDGLVHGIDLVGSMFENGNPPPPNLTKEKVASRIIDLFNLASEKGIPLRLHAFEGQNTGLFYEALESVLKSYTNPIQLRVGHIAQVDGRWVGLLGDFHAAQRTMRPRGEGVVVEANVESNRRLQGTTAADIANTVRALQERGIRVVSGSDGLGILGPRATYIAQQQALDDVVDISGPTVSFDSLHASGPLCDPVLFANLRAAAGIK